MAQASTTPGKPPPLPKSTHVLAVGASDARGPALPQHVGREHHAESQDRRREAGKIEFFRSHCFFLHAKAFPAKCPRELQGM